MDQILGLIDVFWEHLQNGTLPEWSYGNYLVLLVLVIVEGPIVTLLGAAAASAGLMRLPLVFLTVAAGNLIADIGWYCLGYFSKESTLLRYGRWLGLRRRHLARLRWGMRTYARRILLVAKFSTGFIVPTLVAAGLARVPVRRWFPIVFAGEMFWTTLLVLIGISTPSFFLGLLLILFFAVDLRWFPASGMYAIYGGGDLPDLLYHLVMPAVTLAAVATGVIARLTRTAMLEVLRQDYIRTARAKGLSERRVIYRHAFKAALVSVIPVIGIQAGFVLGGAVYIETVFQWPGIGAMLVNAISTRDLLLVQGGVLVVAASYVLFNLAADVIQSTLDPRLRR